jgi:glycosyltransferase involved in cell wall biosynthesis
VAAYWFALTVAHRPLFRLVYGERFMVYAYLIPVISLYLLAWGVVTACDIAFNSIQQPQASIPVKVLMVAITMPASTAMTWRFGLPGAAIGVAACSMMTAVYVTLEVAGRLASATRCGWAGGGLAMRDSFSISAAEGSASLSGGSLSNAAAQGQTLGRAVAAGPPTRTVLVWCSNGDPAGGMERIAINIANGLTGRRWRVVLAGPFASAAVLRAAIRPEVEFIDHDLDRSGLGVYRTMRFIQQVVRQRRIDVISAHGSLFPLLGTRTPVVWTEHDIRYGGCMLHGFRGLAWRWIRRRVHKGAWRVVTVSHYVLSSLHQNLNMREDCGEVIYNGLPDADALRALPLPAMTPPFRIGFLGRLAPLKRPLEVYELSARLNRMGVPHELNVFGDGELMPQMRALAAQPTGHSVRIRGLAKRAEDAFMYMDLFCFLSRGEREGLPTVLLEAIAARRLVVAWNACCIGETLAGRGTLVAPPFSLQRFAEAIADELRNSAHRPQEHDSRWDEGRMIDAYDAVLTDAMRGREAAERRRA